MSHPFSQNLIDQMANEILADLILKQDLVDVFSSLGGDLVNEFVPYTKQESPSTDDLHCELAGVVVGKLVNYIKLGYGRTI